VLEDIVEHVLDIFHACFQRDFVRRGNKSASFRLASVYLNGSGSVCRILAIKSESLSYFKIRDSGDMIRPNEKSYARVLVAVEI
jgi:hypothetical protein